MNASSHASACNCRLAIAFALSALACLAQPGLVLGDRPGDTPVPDYIGTVDRRLFAISATPTTLTKLWANTALGAMGSPDKLRNITRVQLVCDVTGNFGSMLLEVTSANTGELEFKQVLQASGAKVPARTLKFNVAAGSDQAIVGDGDADSSLALPAHALKALRRSGDMWNPVLTILGQFERVESATLETVDGRACVRLTMARPLIEGMTSGKLWLDAATMLPYRAETSVQRDVPISGKYTITQWQTVSGILVPRVALVEGPDGVCTLTFSKVLLSKADGTAL